MIFICSFWLNPSTPIHKPHLIRQNYRLIFTFSTEFIIFRTRVPALVNPKDLPPASSDGRTYVYRTRVPRRENDCGSSSSPPPENNIGVPITRRRGAVKHNKVHIVRGHRLVAKFFRQPTFCAFCKDFLWWDSTVISFISPKIMKKYLLRVFQVSR